MWDNAKYCLFYDIIKLVYQTLRVFVNRIRELKQDFRWHSSLFYGQLSFLYLVLLLFRKKRSLKYVGEWILVKIWTYAYGKLHLSEIIIKGPWRERVRVKRKFKRDPDKNRASRLILKLMLIKSLLNKKNRILWFDTNEG